MATSWGTRKVLGRRYGTDPALLMEAERLEREYGLIPGREARALQAAQFQQSLEQQNKALAQNQSQFDTTQSGNKMAGMVGTAANLGMTGATIRGLTMNPGDKFWGNWGSTPSVPTSVMQGSTPSAGIQSATNPSFWTGPASTGSNVGLGYPGNASAMAGTTPTTGGGLPAVNPSTIDSSASGLAPAGAAAGSGAAYGSQGGIGTGIGELGVDFGMAGYAGPAVAAYEGSRLLGNQFKEDTFANRALRDPLTGIAGEGLRAVGLKGAADQLNRWEKDIIQKPLDTVTNFVSNTISSIFGW